MGLSCRGCLRLRLAAGRLGVVGVVGLLVEVVGEGVGVVVVVELLVEVVVVGVGVVVVGTGT